MKSPPLAIITAVKEEAAPVLKEISNGRKIIHRGILCLQGEFQGKNLVLACTGLGEESVRRGIRYLLERFPISFAIVAGFAGGISTRLESGDIVVGQEILWADGDGRAPSGGSHPRPLPEQEDDKVSNLSAVTPLAKIRSRGRPSADAGESPNGKYSSSFFVKKARRIKSALFKTYAGAIVSSPYIFSSREKKEWKGKALAVDMESWPAGDLLISRQVPFVSIRVITDPYDQDFPMNFQQYLKGDGKIQRGKILLSSLASPQTLSSLLALGKRSKMAAGNLARFLSLYIREL